MSDDNKNVLNDVLSLNDLMQSVYELDPSLSTDALFGVLKDLMSAMDGLLNITITNREGNIMYANDSFAKLFQYENEELIGRNFNRLIPVLFQDTYYNSIVETLSAGENWSGELQSRAKDSSIVWTFTKIIPVFNDQKKAVFYISFQKDINAQKKYDSEFTSRFIRVFQKLQNGIFKIRRDANSIYYTMSSGKLMDRIGANSEVVHGKSPYEVFDKKIADVKNYYYEKAFEGRNVQYELEVNGVLISVSLEPIFNDGIVTEVVGTVHDFSEYRGVQKQLKDNEERYKSLINFSHEHIMMLNKDGKIIHMNPKTMKLFGVEGETFRELNIVDATVDDKKQQISYHVKKALQGEVQFFEFEVKNEQLHIYLNVTLIPIIVDNKIDGVYAMGTDITNQKEIQELNAYLAHHDELTALPNRRWMEQKIKDTLNSNQIDSNEVAILSLDLDRFKSINDTLGHVAGDKLLQEIAVRLSNLASGHKQMHVARMGGDEFFVLCTGIESKEEITEIANAMLKALEEPIYIEDFEVIVTVSIGIVLNPSSNAGVIGVMKKVDVALYKSKELGRNMFQVYENSMIEGNFRSFVLERDLRKAIHNDEFVAYLQPRVNALTGKFVGAEALIRWNHPEHGLISPAEFIPIAEDTGLIMPIGSWMKRKVCELLVRWKNAGIPLIPISVNISSKRLLQAEFAQEIQELLNGYNLDGEWLEIEITENTIMSNEKSVQRTLKALYEMGVKVFIDDFGTGYSSFNYLKTFEIDGIKIDRSFIQDIAEKPENASITSAMIKMAQALDLEVIAEGVETREELDFLLKEGCHFIQGYYFGRPCPIEEFEKSYFKSLN